MTSPTIMNREQLLELAALDAYGLLDEFEAELYTRSFHHAPAAVQDEIIRFQSELAADPTLLPQEEPPAELRQRVLQAVSRAIERQHSELAPLATIGRRRETSDNYVDSRYVFRPAALWRAAAFILAGAVAVMAYFWSQSNEYARDLARLALSNLTSEELKQKLRPDYEEFVSNPTVVARVMRPLVNNFPGSATVFVDGTTDQAFVLIMGLPVTAGEYELRVTHADGTSEMLRQFASIGPVNGLRFENLAKATLAVTAVWEVIDASGAVVLRST